MATRCNPELARQPHLMDIEAASDRQSSSEAIRPVASRDVVQYSCTPPNAHDEVGLRLFVTPL